MNGLSFKQPEFKEIDVENTKAMGYAPSGKFLFV